MLVLAEIVLPVFLVLGAGYFAVRQQLFAAGHADALMRFTQNFAIPSLLFLAISRLDLGLVFKPGLLASYYIGSLVSFTLGILGARFLFKRRPGEAVAVGFTALFGNTVLLGLPIMERAYGAGSLQPNFAIVAIHAPFCYLLGITTMEFSRADGRSLFATLAIVAKAMFSNALTISLMLGFVVNLINLPLPAPLTGALEMIARAALPAALFALGGVLVRYRLGTGLREVAMICVISLIIHPGIAYLLSVYVFSLSDGFVKGVVVTAAMAPGVNSFVFANMYGRAKGTVASAVLIGTVMSIFSAAVWLWILGT
jgi:malonate transporter and related proteins